MDSLRVAVTGGSGRVGRFVVRHLLERGYRVINLDRRRGDDERARFVYCDVRSRDTLAMALGDCDAVCHLADIPHVRLGPSLDEVYWSNARSGSAVLQTAADLRLRRVIYTSTCQVYGFFDDGRIPPVRLPVDETHPHYPSNAYAISKTATEAFAEMTSRRQNLAVTILRLPGVMVEEPSNQRLAAIEREDGPIDDGLKTFVQADDAARAYVAALESNLPGCEAFNICADDVMSALPIAGRLARRHPDFPQLPADWPPHKSPMSNDKAKAKLGWRPTWSFVDFFRRRLGRDPLAG
jgi:nucleoside-diphosphate-sugar epimerase